MHQLKLTNPNVWVHDGDTIAVWFSCGVASAVAAKKTIELYGHRCKIRILNNPIKEEHPDNKRFLKDVEKWLGYEIEVVTNKKWPNASCVEVWDYNKLMSTPYGAPCTRSLKKRARAQWEKNNHFDWIVLGFTSEELNRHNRFVKGERSNLLPILIESGYDKQDCFDIMRDEGIKMPEIYNHGFPNANCIGCVKSSSPTYWNLVRREFPLIFEERAQQSRRVGSKLVKVKGQRIHLDELDPDAFGRKLKNYHVECGIFCEEAS